MMSPAQQEVFDLHEQGVGFTEIARRLGKSRATVRVLHNRALLWDRLDGSTQDAMAATNAAVVPRRYWAKTKNPDGTSYSVLYELKPEEEDFLAKIKDAFTDIPAIPEIERPAKVLADLMTVVPLFDAHVGLRTMASITGEDYDLEIAAKRMKEGMAACLSGTPNSARLVLINGGDFTHADDDTNATPRNRHVLDVASRNYETIEASVEILTCLIEMGLTRHDRVDYFSVPGNHDPKNWVTIMFALAERYRNNPRVYIEKSAVEFSTVIHGENLVAIHHGHQRPVKDLIMFFAAEYPKLWGEATNRVVLTGHKHHKALQEFPGITWEQIAPITPRDHYSVSGAYWSKPELQAITYDLKSEVSRTKVLL